MSYTKGPITVQVQPGVGATLHAGEGYLGIIGVAAVHTDSLPLETAEANARLWAEAPEMVRLLRQVADLGRDEAPNDLTVIHARNVMRRLGLVYYDQGKAQTGEVAE